MRLPVPQDARFRRMPESWTCMVNRWLIGARMAAKWNGLERTEGIEPSYAAWEAAVLPLNYARMRLI